MLIFLMGIATHIELAILLKISYSIEWNQAHFYYMALFSNNEIFFPEGALAHLPNAQKKKSDYFSSWQKVFTALLCL